MKVREAEEIMDRARTPAELVAAIDKAKAAKVPASAIQRAEQRLAEMKARDAVNTVARCRLGAAESMGWDGAGWGGGAHAAARVCL